ncbi:MAG: bifunctional DNA-formamidopyrimidine glycosylase/DNA-(apurinic or apyrimidinic site) lyase [Streptosporangiaceae bacterium]
MPELPEVETLRRCLSPLVAGRPVVSVDVLDSRIFAAPPAVINDQLTGHRIDRVARRGKVLILFLREAGSLLIHPRMTGQIVVTAAGMTVLAGGHPTPSLLGPMPGPTTRVILALDEASSLYYNDSRRFGWIRLASDAPCADDPFLRRLGPEPLTGAFTVAVLRAGITRHARAPVKAVLLNQAVVAGIGNVYADECLYHARIHPGRRAGDLSMQEIRRLHGAIQAVLRAAIATGGTSFAGYINDFRGWTGYLDHAAVFRRQGQPCRRCGTKILATKIAGRRTRFCPRCQPEAP